MPPETASGANVPTKVMQEEVGTTVTFDTTAAASSAAPSQTSAVAPTDGGTALGVVSLPDSVVVCLHSCACLPTLAGINRTLISPYAIAWLQDDAGLAVGPVCSWVPRPDTRYPVWNTAQDLGLPAELREQKDKLQRIRLHVEIWDHDALLPPSPIAQCDVPLLSLLPAGGFISVPLLASDLASPTASAPSSPVRGGEPAGRGPIGTGAPLVNLLKLTLNAVSEPIWRSVALTDSGPASPSVPGRELPKPDGSRATMLLRLVPTVPLRKRLYVIRHGESEWNKAQGSLNLGGMYSQVDHPLSAGGRRQAEALAEAIQAGIAAGTAAGATAEQQKEAAALQDLCASKLVLSSPLTRALQTCLMALGPALRERQQVVRLSPNARERLNHGSADSFGAALGAGAVRSRLVDKTAELHGGNVAAAEAALGDIPLDDLEVRTRWWSAVPETKEAMAKRLEALLQQVRYEPEESIVLVGHSHHIRELLKANLHPSVAERDSEYASLLKKYKLANCGVACLDLDFGADGPPIMDVRLLVGTRLVP